MARTQKQSTEAAVREIRHRTLRLHVCRSGTPNGRVRLNGFDALPQGTATKEAVALFRRRRP
jgi:hypothetical protein